MTALVPAGADEVSVLAATAFAAGGVAMLAVNTAAQEELARTGVALTDIARMYSQVDGETAGTLVSAGSKFFGQPFTGGTGAGLLRAETLPGAVGRPPGRPCWRI
ncbi:MAG: PE family protein [Mycobacterium sp.]